LSDDRDRGLAAVDQVEDLLEAYAEARLSPSGPVLARMRTHVVAQAAQFAAAQAAAREAAELDAHPSRWALASLRLPRRAMSLGLAAALTLGTSAAVFAAPPGSPFFNARIAIEAAFLPSQSDARLASHEQHLLQRLAEAEAAAARGDLASLAAALAAYDAEVDAALADLGDDPTRLAHLEAMLANHLIALTALEVRLPEEAAIDQALQSSQRVVEKIKEKSHQGGKPSLDPRPTREPNTNGGGGGDDAPGGQRNPGSQ
jgi:hypothetical protein